jgi:hypothetical protein
MKAIRWAVQLCVLGVMACRLCAEKIDMDPGELRETATHVIVGEIVHVYERKEVDKEWSTTHYVAEVRVKEIEKGGGIEKGGLVYVRYWRRSWVGEGHIPPSTVGHRGAPKSGESLRIYMSRNAYDGFGTTNDGGFNVIGANGFERLKD